MSKRKPGGRPAPRARDTGPLPPPAANPLPAWVPGGLLALAAALLLFFGLSAINKPLTADEAKVVATGQNAATTAQVMRWRNGR